MGGPEMAPQTPQRAERPGEPVALLDSASLQRVEGRRRSVAPAIGDDPEGLDEALPAAGEADRHAEVEDLVVAEVAAERLVERLVDRWLGAGEPVGQPQRRLRSLGQVGAL